MSSTTTKKSTTKKNNDTVTVSKEEYENLLNQMKEMQTMFAQITSQQQPVQNITQYIGENNKDVVVTSLTVGQLNLSTEGYGQGEIYTFEHIGEEQSIPLEDLKKIIKNNKSFVEGGNFFINDDDVVKSQKLTNIYKKLLSYDEMLDLSKQFPETVFCLYGEGEGSEDMWYTYYKNGKLQHCPAKITFDVYDESKLE
jgi:hypothetical protein